MSPKTQGSDTISPEQLDVDGLEHCLYKLYHMVSFRARLQQTHATDSTTPGQRVDESISQRRYVTNFREVLKGMVEVGKERSQVALATCEGLNYLRKRAVRYLRREVVL